MEGEPSSRGCWLTAASGGLRPGGRMARWDPAANRGCAGGPPSLPVCTRQEMSLVKDKSRSFVDYSALKPYSYCQNCCSQDIQ